MEYIFPTTHIHTRDYDIPHELLAEKIEISLNETSYPVLCWIDVVPSIRHFSSVQISCIRISSSAAVQNVTTSFFSGTKTFFCTKLLHNLYMLFIQQNDIVYFSMKTLCTSNLLASNKHHGYETVQPPFGCCKKCVCFFSKEHVSAKLFTLAGEKKPIKPILFFFRTNFRNIEDESFILVKRHSDMIKNKPKTHQIRKHNRTAFPRM